MPQKATLPSSILQLLEKRETKERRVRVRRAKTDRRTARTRKPVGGPPPNDDADDGERRSGKDRRRAPPRRQKMRRKSN